MIKKIFYLSVCLIFVCISCTMKKSDNLSLPAIFSDNMVLQQNTDVTIWGNSRPYRTIKLTSNWGEKVKSSSDKEGKWLVIIHTPEAGGPYELKITDSDTIINIQNIMVGEVWLCSGQSNMEMPMQGFSSVHSILGGIEEIKNANYPDIRMFTVKKAISEKPKANCKGTWAICMPETAGSFSATAFFFGKKLNMESNIPIGLIHSSWGGTPVESWTSGKYLENHEDFKETIEKIKESQAIYQELRDWLKKHDRIDMATIQSDKPFKGIDFNDSICAKIDYNDNNWDTIQLPQLWEKTKIGSFDGAIWFRKKINIPAAWEGKTLQLNLGPIDDMDVVYINGVKIGGYEIEGYWDKPREYEINPEFIKTGENLIAVRVIDNRGGGGIYGKKSDMQLFIKNGNKKDKINISGPWSYIVATEFFDNVFYLFDISKNEYNEKPEIEIELNPNTASMLYNAMIAPLIPYTLKGAIWYQGEENVGRANQYEQTFPLMIKNWREDWKLGDFPFYYVQLAPWNYSTLEGTESADLRDAQRRTLIIPNTGMAVTLDIGNVDNIHPANKKDVGERLAFWALAKDYGQDIVYSGPLYKSMQVEGNKIRISFDYAENGLKTMGKKLTGFEIAGEDKDYFPAIAEIEQNEVVVYNPKIINPAFVRYAYHNGSEATLFNLEGLPASSFTSEEKLP